MKSIFRIGMILALGVVALQTTLSAQDDHTIVGVWAFAQGRLWGTQLF